MSDRSKWQHRPWIWIVDLSTIVAGLALGIVSMVTGVWVPPFVLLLALGCLLLVLLAKVGWLSRRRRLANIAAVDLDYCVRLAMRDAGIPIDRVVPDGQRGRVYFSFREGLQIDVVADLDSPETVVVVFARPGGKAEIDEIPTSELTEHLRKGPSALLHPWVTRF